MIFPRVYRKEQKEYDKTQFFSDVGGAAGLLLGISLTSLFGMLDSILWLTVQFCVRNKNKIKQKFMHRSNLNDQCVSCDLYNKELGEGRRQSFILGNSTTLLLTVQLKFQLLFLLHYGIIIFSFLRHFLSNVLTNRWGVKKIIILMTIFTEIFYTFNH